MALLDETVESWEGGELHGAFLVGRDGEWRVFMRLASRDEGRAILEVQVTATAKAGPGGLGAKRLRAIPLAGMQQALRRRDASMNEEMLEGIKTLTFTDAQGRVFTARGHFLPSDALANQLRAEARADRGVARKGPKPRPLRELAAFARDYVDACEHSAAPIEALMARGMSRWQVTNRVREARRQELLTPTAQGRAGGELTTRARVILAATQGDDDGEH